MNNDSEQVTALIRELLVLNRAETAVKLKVPIAKETATRKSERKRIRQELVQVLNLRDGAKR